jgi:hypothetical protein
LAVVTPTFATFATLSVNQLKLHVKKHHQPPSKETWLGFLAHHIQDCPPWPLDYASKSAFHDTPVAYVQELLPFTTAL